MEQTTLAADLQIRIKRLENRKTQEWIELKVDFMKTYESLKPLNLLKHTWNELRVSPDLKTQVVNGAISYGAGLIARKVLTGSAPNPVKKLFGLCIELFVAGKVNDNIESIKAAGNAVLEKLKSKQPDQEPV